MFGKFQTISHRGKRRNASGRAKGDWRAVWLLRASITVVVIAAVWWNPYQKPPINIWLGVTILILGVWPLDRWLSGRGTRTIPIFPLHLLFYALCFGFAAFVDVPRLIALQLRVDESSYVPGLVAAIICIMALHVGHFFGQRTKGTWLARVAPRFQNNLDKQAALLLYPVFMACSLFLKFIPVSGLQQIVEGSRVFCLVWVLFAAWSGTIPKKYKQLVIYLILPVDFVLFSGLIQGYLVGILVYGELLVVAFVLCKKRVPLLLIACGVMAFVVLQPIKHYYRAVAWGPESSISAMELAELVAGHTSQSFETGAEDEDWRWQVADTYSRLHHLSTTAAVMQEVEATQGYEHGKTLLPLLSKWIPRAVWPNKPIEDLGNRWGRAYGFLDSTDDVTSYNLPWLPEMFMNFGWPGVVIISSLLGLLIANIEKGVMERVRSPVEMAFAYVIASTFFFPESNMSLMLGGLIINWITISVFLVALRLLKQVRRSQSGAATP